MKEEWRPIKGYEGLYEVSNLGRVRNIQKSTMKKGYVTKPGYKRIELWKNNKGKKFFCPQTCR